MIVPIFQSHFNCAKGTLTCEKSDIIKKNSPISIISIAKKHQLKEVFLLDYTWSGFFQICSKLQEEKISLRFGQKFNVCNNLKEKSDESLKTQSLVQIWALNKNGYQQLLKINNFSFLADNFYYTNRLDWESLDKLNTKDLMVVIDFYNGFIARNFLEGYKCLPLFQKYRPTMGVNRMGLPFDSLIFDKLKEFAMANKLNLQELHPIYYYSNEEFESYLCDRCIGERSTMDKPQLNHMSINTFSFEEYCRKVGIKFLGYDE